VRCLLHQVVQRRLVRIWRCCKWLPQLARLRSPNHSHNLNLFVNVTRCHACRLITVCAPDPVPEHISSPAQPIRSAITPSRGHPYAGGKSLEQARLAGPAHTSAAAPICERGNA